MAFWAAVAATAAPLLCTRYLPFTDLPEHVAVMATLARWFDAGGGDHATYDMTFARSQYLLYHSAGALLTRVVGDAILANRLLLVGIAIALPLAVHAALRAFGRDDGLAVLACMPFLSRPLFVGFLPYVASLPLYFFGIALVVRRAALPPERRRRDTTLLAVLSIALFYTHLSALLVFVATAVVLEISIAARQPDAAADGLARWSLSRLRALAWLSPIAALSAFWMFAGRITLRGDSLADPGEIGKMHATRSLHALPLWAFDVFRSHVDEVCGVVWWMTLAVLAVLGVRAATRVPAPEPAPTARQHHGVLRVLGLLDPAYVPLFCVLTMYFATPFRIGAGGMLNVRLAPLVALTAILTVGSSRGRWRTTLLCGAAVASITYGVNAIGEMRAVAKQHMTGFDEILGAMRPGTRLVTLAFDQRVTHTHFDPYPFAGSYHRVAGGLVASYSFSDLVHWPLQYRSEVRPPQKPTPLWIYHPCAYKNAVDGPYYDYVLVSGGFDVFGGEPSGPAFREVRRVPNFVLYEKVAGEEWTGEDNGPCDR